MDNNTLQTGETLKKKRGRRKKTNEQNIQVTIEESETDLNHESETKNEVVLKKKRKKAKGRETYIETTGKKHRTISSSKYNIAFEMFS